jgi:maltose alpha-D-glucosyltransferase/alpha-amylase
LNGGKEVNRTAGNGAVVSLADEPRWYQDAVIYELHVRAFHDSNGDGIGDFRGLVDKLDYVQDLGVTALWLLPFYPSPLRDDGYDIADYTNVNPIYGSRGDFKLFLKEAHRRGLRVITELVINHTSDQHPWFQRARRAPAGSPQRDFYVWSDTTARYQEARIIFKDFEPSNWTWDSVAKAYFWHRFYAHQPDLNFDNPEVHQAIFEVLDFWLSLGIDGFRLDAIPYLYEREGTNCENLPETHAFLKALRRHIDAKYPQRMLLAEANQWPEDSAAYFGAGDECHMNFHFPVMPRLFMATHMEDRLPVIDILQQTPAIPENCQWAIFLRNHDELTLEMVTDEDRDYMYRFYAQDQQMRINLGIRRRLAPLLDNHRGKIELLNGLLLSLPGTPVLYYGDEIGMGDNIYLGDRNGVRTPMQWTAGRNAGFSEANPQRLYFPLVIDPEYHYEVVNVEAQQKNPNSLLWWMKHLLALRKRYRAFGRGSLEFLYPDNHKVLAFLRRHQDETLLVVANLSRFPQYAELDLAALRGLVPVEVLGRTPFPAVGDGPYRVTLGGYAFFWFALRQARTTEAVPAPAERDLPALEVGGDWETIVHGKAKASLEEVLPGFLKGCHWFGGKDRPVKAVTVEAAVPLSPGKEKGSGNDRVLGPEEAPLRKSVTLMALLRVDYADDDRETYLLPLGFASGVRAENLLLKAPQRVIGWLRVRPRGKTRRPPAKETLKPGEDLAEEGVLVDAVGEKGFAEVLLDAIARHRRFKGPGPEVAGCPSRSFAELRGPADVPLEAALLPREDGETLVAYGDRLVLKVFRRVEEGIQPELEMNRFLTEKTSFAHVPRVAGALELKGGPGLPRTLAVLETLVPNEGTAWQFTRDALGRYFERALTLQVPAQQLPLPVKPSLDLVDADLPVRAQEIIGGYLGDANLLGRRTAELHVALASSPDDPDFAPEPFTALYQRSVYQSVRTQTRQTFEQLRKQLRELGEEAREEGSQVLEREQDLLQRLRLIFERKVTAARIRCHGDYHLGHVLYTGKDFLILDLENDPGRSVNDRRRKRSPLRDVASLLRSFHYATASALRKGNIRPADVDRLEVWARLWQIWVSVAFLKGYLGVEGTAAVLPPTRPELGLLLDCYLVKRALTELRSELKSRTERIRVPLQGLLRILRARD